MSEEKGFPENITEGTISIKVAIGVVSAAAVFLIGAGGFAESMLNYNKKVNAIVANDKRQDARIARCESDKEYQQRQISELKHWLRPIKLIEE